MNHESLIQVDWDVDEDDRKTGVVVLTLNQPDKKNALTVAMGEELKATVSRLTSESTLRSVVITGAGDAFSAGGDFAFLKARTEASRESNTFEMKEFYDRFLSLRRLPVPTIAAMQGPAIGAGLCLGLACDMRLCAEDAKLGATFVGLGLHPGMGATHFLPQIVGPQSAARLLLTGEVILGWEAKQLGMVIDALPRDAVLPHTLKLARKMAAQGPVAVQTCVRSLRCGQEDMLNRALWREAEAQATCYATEDLKNGIDAVQNRRKVVFSGS